MMMASQKIPSVKELLLSRSRTRPTKIERSDPYHLALVIEGGGMRGVIAGGMVSSLEENNLLSCFDSIHGSSAGACAGAYFAAKQASLGTRIYYEDINNKLFINLFRILRGEPVMNTDFLIDYIMKSVKPLDVQAILSRQNFLYIVCTNALTAQTEVFSNFHSKEYFFSVLKASITIPVIAGGPVLVGDKKLLDGGITQQIAVESAAKVGATHILVLLTRRNGEFEESESFFYKMLERRLLGRLGYSMIAQALMDRKKNINYAIEQLMSRRNIGGAKMDYITLSAGGVRVGRLTTDYRRLVAADVEARLTVSDYLRGQIPQP